MFAREHSHTQQIEWAGCQMLRLKKFSCFFDYYVWNSECSHFRYHMYQYFPLHCLHWSRTSSRKSMKVTNNEKKKWKKPTRQHSSSKSSCMIPIGNTACMAKKRTNNSENITYPQINSTECWTCFSCLNFDNALQLCLLGAAIEQQYHETSTSGSQAWVKPGISVGSYLHRYYEFNWISVAVALFCEAITSARSIGESSVYGERKVEKRGERTEEAKKLCSPLRDESTCRRENECELLLLSHIFSAL